MDSCEIAFDEEDKQETEPPSITDDNSVSQCRDKIQTDFRRRLQEECSLMEEGSSSENRDDELIKTKRIPTKDIICTSRTPSTFHYDVAICPQTGLLYCPLDGLNGINFTVDIRQSLQVCFALILMCYGNYRLVPCYVISNVCQFRIYKKSCQFS